MKNMELTTKRLLLRKPVPADFDRLWEMLTDPLAKQYTGGVTRLGYTERRALFLEECATPFTEAWTEFAVVERASGLYLGYCGFITGEESGKPEFLYGYRRDAWGRGYGTEAALAALRALFRVYNHDAYIATAEDENAASKRILEKLGFLPEADFGVYRLTRARFFALNGA